MNSDSTLILDNPSDSLVVEGLSVALIGPDEKRRKAASKVLAMCQGGTIREYASYPPSLHDVPKLLEQQYDVIIIDLDSRPEYALQLVENICARGAATVMVYSNKSDSEQLVRCMRAGAREFFTLPISEDTIIEALVRVAVRRPPKPSPPKKAGGKLMAFLGAKGGDGVTTLACNFAVSMAKESGQSTLLIDLDLPLGDAALNLGVVAEYSAINALQNTARLDSAFLSKLLVKHSSGVTVLAAPGKFPQYDAPHQAIDKLLTVARQDFDNVVIDMGSRLDLMNTSIFKEGSTVYLVIQAGIAGLRNSNRLISRYFSTDIPRLEIVLNRYQSRTLGVSEDQITKALTRAAQWKIPNDYAAVRRMQHTAIPLALEDSPISRLIRQMTRTACGLPLAPEKGSGERGSGFSLKNLSRSFTSKLSSSEEPPTASIPELESIEEKNTSLVPDLVAPAPTSAALAQVEATSSLGATLVPAIAPPPMPDTQPLSPAAQSSNATEVKTEESPVLCAPSQTSGPETRTYRGATYLKGEDGKWYLQKARAATTGAAVDEPVKQQTPVITWPAPAPISYGVKLCATELNATASVAGKFVYSPNEGAELVVGEHTLSAHFTPEDTKSYTGAEATVKLAVTKAISSITWDAPAPIAYGTALDGSQLNASASVPGELIYLPAAGEVLATGEHTLLVAFTPADTASYKSASAAVPISVVKAIPLITWNAPAPIAYGTALSSYQLNATASVPGEFCYSPAAGEVLAAGEHTLLVAFSPADAASYASTSAAVPISVAKAIPSISWDAPAPIAYGAALSSYQLNATASVPGEFLYSPPAGEMLVAGEHTLSVGFTPRDDVNYTGSRLTTSLTVTKATPIILWPPVEAITEGTPLGADQLNATALVEGSFEYTPAAGEVLAAGTHTLSVTFTPKAAGKYNSVQSSLSLTVIAVPSAIEGLPPAPAETIGSTATIVPAEDPAPATAVAVEFQTSASPASLLPEHPPAEYPADTTAGAEAISVSEAFVEPAVEPTIEPPSESADEKVVEAVEAAPEKAIAVKAEAAPAVDAPAIPVAEVKAPSSQIHTEAPEQALVKIPPPKFTFEAGSGLNLMGTAVFPDGTTIYLVMQPGSGGHADSQRLVSQFLSGGELKPEIAINRYDPHSFEEGEEQAGEDLTRSVNLRAAAQMDAFQQVATMRGVPGKKRGFLKSLRRSLWAKVASNEKLDPFMQLELMPEQNTGAANSVTPTAQVHVSSSAFSSAAPSPGHIPDMPMPPACATESGQAQTENPILSAAPSVETRTYQGATYAKGGDGKWHLQRTPSRVVKRESPPGGHPVQSYPIAVTPAPLVPLAVEPLPVASAQPGSHVLYASAAATTEEQLPVVVANSPAEAKAPDSIHVESAVVVAEVEAPQNATKADAEPLVEAETITPIQTARVQTKEMAQEASRPIRKPVVKTQGKAAAKAKSKAKTAVKTAAKSRKAVKAPAKSAAKAKKGANVQAKAATKDRKRAKSLAKPTSKAALIKTKNVKTPAKKAAKSAIPSRTSPNSMHKAAAKGKKLVKAGSKTHVKTAARKIKSSAKPKAKKNSVKAPARKPVKKR